MMRESQKGIVIRLACWFLMVLAISGCGGGKSSSKPAGGADPIIISGNNMSAGFGYHNLVIQNGSLWAWGRNADGRLGVGDEESRLAPTQVDLTGVRAVASGDSRSLAVTTDGAVWGWGFDGWGYIEWGGNSPKKIHSDILTNIAAVEIGSNLFLALSADGKVYAWGANNWGEVGDGTETQRNTPVLISQSSFNNKRVVAISAGYQHSMALTEDGKVWAWGVNGVGQLGDGTTEKRMIPTQVAGLANIKAIRGGNSFSLALKSDGTVWAWGDINGSIIPIQVSSLSGITAIAAGDQHCMALDRDGQVRVWGYFFGTSYPGPQLITSLSGVTAIAAGTERCFAKERDGSIWAWGNNSDGALGDGTTVNKSDPVQVVFP